MKILNCDRTGCHTARGALVRYSRLVREFRCECGHSFVLQSRIMDGVVAGYTPTCPECGVVDTVVYADGGSAALRIAAEVMDALPAEFRKLVAPETTPDVDLEAIKQALF